MAVDLPLAAASIAEPIGVDRHSMRRERLQVHEHDPQEAVDVFGEQLNLPDRGRGVAGQSDRLRRERPADVGAVAE
uniref:Uncharacterized protein n=1 Tax=Schlesneria paludicola TaxID=360056 RepID=A0A7C4LM68_9PLAN